MNACMHSFDRFESIRFDSMGSVDTAEEPVGLESPQQTAGRGRSVPWLAASRTSSFLLAAAWLAG